jgi:hypothetical protein
MTYAATFSVSTNLIGQEKENEFISVIATGHGITEGDALKNALKNSIQMAIGQLIKSETQLKNGKVIEDSIFAEADGFVREYQKLSILNENGVVKVRIKALVKLHALSTRVQKLNISVLQIKKTEDIYSRLNKKLEQKKDADKIFKQTFDNLFSNESLSELVSIKIEKFQFIEDKASANEVPVEITYNLSIDHQDYAQKIEKIEAVFERLGAKLSKKIDFPSLNSTYGLIGKSYLRLRKIKPYEFILVKKYAQGYRTDIWSFSEDYMDLYPFKKLEAITLQDRFQLIFEFENDNGEILLRKPIIRKSYEDKLKLLVGVIDFVNSKAFYNNSTSSKQEAPVLIPLMNGGKKSINVLGVLQYNSTLNVPVAIIGRIQKINLVLKNK